MTVRNAFVPALLWAPRPMLQTSVACPQQRFRTLTCRSRIVCQVPDLDLDVALRRAEVSGEQLRPSSSTPGSMGTHGASNPRISEADDENELFAVFSAGLQAILEDLLERPDYYVNAFGALLGSFLSVVVLSTTLDALHHLPIVPEFLRIVGLLYCIWFSASYVLSPKARNQLIVDIDEFVDVVVGDKPESLQH
jgi:CAAD domains of cyanobacterial aminoacyl-tRNA synthetase